jgi:hypothetical protein
MTVSTQPKGILGSGLRDGLQPNQLRISERKMEWRCARRAVGIRCRQTANSH